MTTWNMIRKKRGISIKWHKRARYSKQSPKWYQNLLISRSRNVNALEVSSINPNFNTKPLDIKESIRMWISQLIYALSIIHSLFCNCDSIWRLFSWQPPFLWVIFPANSRLWWLDMPRDPSRNSFSRGPRRYYKAGSVAVGFSLQHGSQRVEGWKKHLFPLSTGSFQWIKLKRWTKGPWEKCTVTHLW